MSTSPVSRTERRVAPSATVERDAEEARAVILAVNVLLRRRWQIAAITLVLPFIVGVVTLLQPRTYTAVASFIPQAKTQPSQIAGLAAQFGVNVGATDASQSPVFYAEVLESRPILERLASQVFDIPVDGTERRDTLANLVAPKVAAGLARRAEAVVWLHGVIDGSAAARTGIVTASVRTRWPRLSYELTNALIVELNRFNLETRKSHASSERAFTEQRLAEVSEQLRSAENRLQAFLERNRQYSGSPELKFEYDRLTREITFKQDLTNSLTQSYEQAKIEEVRDTPVFTVIEPPEIPMRADPRGTIRRVALALIVGMMLGIAVAFTRRLFAPEPSADDPYAELKRLRSEARADLLHPVRAIRGARP
jgi:uncharacterized protein involved in exopolysaccharide biosynthesis